MRKTYLLFAFLLLPFANAFGQQFEQLAAKTKVIYIVNFIKYIEWPPDYRSGDFVIGVLNGSPAMLEELNKMAATKTAGSQKFVIKNFKSIEEIDKCNIIYIPEGSNGLLAEVTKKVRGKSTLIITETEGDARKGAAINFIAKDNKQAFELNKSTAEKSGLVVSSGLKALAAVNIE